jgi:hypothetical protein
MRPASPASLPFPWAPRTGDCKLRLQLGDAPSERPALVLQVGTARILTLAVGAHPGSIVFVDSATAHGFIRSR